MSALFEFYLPNIEVGLPDLETVLAEARIRDQIAFDVAGARWTLRQMVMCDGTPTPGDVALSKAIVQQRLRKWDFAPACLLQVSTEQLSREQASKTADDLCWLLRLPLGQKVAWVELGQREDGSYTFLQRRSVTPPAKVSKNRLLYNYGDEVLKRYLQAAYPIYQKDETWWQLTLHWFAIAYENPVIEVTGLICSMLLERIANFLLREQKPAKQIDEALDQKLDLEWAAKDSELIAALEQALGTVTSKWSRDRSVELLRKIKEWNQVPSYAAKIKTILDPLGLPSPSGKFLQNRHSLAHEGELKSYADPSEYHNQITELVTSLLLKIFKYSGRYFVLGVGENNM